jgi:hypothetical protein
MGQTEDAQSSQVDLSVIRNIAGFNDANYATVNLESTSDAGDIDVILGFTGGVNNPADFSAGAVEIFAEIAPFPVLK